VLSGSRGFAVSSSLLGPFGYSNREERLTSSLQAASIVEAPTLAALSTLKLKTSTSIKNIVRIDPEKGKPENRTLNYLTVSLV
jgi:hypothetical protein